MSMITYTHAELENFFDNIYVRPTPADGMIAYTTLVVGGSLQVVLNQYFETTADRDALLAKLPKSYRVRATGPTTIGARFDFAANGVTGDVNETAAKRLRAILKKLDALDVPVIHRAQRVINDQPNLDEVLAMIDAPIAVR